MDYVKLDDAGNTGSFTDEVDRAIAKHDPDHLCVTEPGEWRIREEMKSWSSTFDREAILKGHQPVELTTWDMLNRIKVPIFWSAQEQKLGFK